jgi:hypothetical protein
MTFRLVISRSTAVLVLLAGLLVGVPYACGSPERRWLTRLAADRRVQHGGFHSHDS